MSFLTVIFRISLLVSISCLPDIACASIDDHGKVDVDSLIVYAKKFVGIPYKWSGNTPAGFDCSGFVSFVYAHYCVSLPRSSVDYFNVGVPVSSDSCRKGDIILFSGTDNNLAVVGHVGIVISNPGEPISFIHSSSSKKHLGVIISELKGTGYVDRFIGMRRLPVVD
jgi:peptidoglycan DL-endopeptidase CwlO